MSSINYRGLATGRHTDTETHQYRRAGETPLECMLFLDFSRLRQHRSFFNGGLSPLFLTFPVYHAHSAKSTVLGTNKHSPTAPQTQNQTLAFTHTWLHGTSHSHLSAISPTEPPQPVACMLHPGGPAHPQRPDGRCWLSSAVMLGPRRAAGRPVSEYRSMFFPEQ